MRQGDMNKYHSLGSTAHRTPHGSSAHGSRQQLIAKALALALARHGRPLLMQAQSTLRFQHTTLALQRLHTRGHDLKQQTKDLRF